MYFSKRLILSPYGHPNFRLLWSNERNQVMELENSPIHFEQEQLHPEVPTAQSKLQTIPYELMLFDQKKRKVQKS